MVLKAEYGNRDDNRKERRDDDRKWKGDRCLEAMCPEYAGDISPKPEKAGLRQLNGTCIAEEELKADYQDRVDASNGKQPQVVRASYRREICERNSPGRQWQVYAFREPGQRSFGSEAAFGAVRLGAGSVHRKYLGD